MSRKKQRRATTPQKQTTAMVLSRFEALLRRGTELLAQGQAEAAIHPLDLAYQLQPENADAVHNLSSAYILRGRFKKAVPLLEKLIAAHPDNAHYHLNLVAAYLGNPVLATDEQQLQAIAAFEKALVINPIISNAAYNIGLIYRDRGEKEQAVHWFNRAIQTNPNDHHARSILSRLQSDEEE